MKKIICLLLALCFVLGLAACDNFDFSFGKSQETENGEATIQSFSAKKPTVVNTFNVDGIKTAVALDLTGGWSAEYTADGVNVYDGPNDGEREVIAHGFFISKQVYDENAADYSSNEAYEEVDNGFKVTGDDIGCHKYLFAIGNGQYFDIDVKIDAKPEPIYARFFLEGVDTPDYVPTVDGIDYLVLVNKTNPLPSGWEDVVETVEMTNSVGDTIEIEKKTYEAYELLKDDLEKNDGIEIDLDSGRRTVAAQQEIMDSFIERYGEDYAAKTVAVPGYSEHHTGLAIDLYFRIDGEDIYYNEDLVRYPDIWEQIHAKLADYGFILRYIDGKEHITGYANEPWHIRYVGNAVIANEIMTKGITLEEYLGKVTDNLEIDFGESDIFDENEIDTAMLEVKCEIAGWKGVDLKNLRYAGDEADSDENLAWLEDVSGVHYINAIELLTDFHTSDDTEEGFEPDYDYDDYQWWLGSTQEGSWEIVTFGY